MGWSSGLFLAEDTWKLVREHIPAEKRKKIAAKIIELFRSHDADDYEPDMKIMQDAEHPWVTGDSEDG